MSRKPPETAAIAAHTPTRREASRQCRWHARPARRPKRQQPPERNPVPRLTPAPAPGAACRQHRPQEPRARHRWQPPGASTEAKHHLPAKASSRSSPSPASGVTLKPTAATARRRQRRQASPPSHRHRPPAPTNDTKSTSPANTHGRPPSTQAASCPPTPQSTEPLPTPPGARHSRLWRAPRPCQRNRPHSGMAGRECHPPTNAGSRVPSTLTASATLPPGSTGARRQRRL